MRNENAGEEGEGLSNPSNFEVEYCLAVWTVGHRRVGLGCLGFKV